MLHNKSSLIAAAIFGALYLLYKMLNTADKREVESFVAGETTKLVDQKLAEF